MAELSTLGSVIKTAYEGQTNTNAFTDALQTKLNGLNAANYATAAQGALADTALQSVPAGVAVPDAAADPVTAAEFNALLASLRGAGLIAS